MTLILSSTWSLAAHVSPDILKQILFWCTNTADFFRLMVGTGSKRLQQFVKQVDFGPDWQVQIRFASETLQLFGIANHDLPPMLDLTWFMHSHLTVLNVVDYYQDVATKVGLLTQPLISDKLCQFPHLRALHLNVIWFRAIASPTIDLSHLEHATITSYKSVNDKTLFTCYNQRNYQYGLGVLCPQLETLEMHVCYTKSPTMATDDFEACNWVRLTAPVTMTHLIVKALISTPGWMHRFLYLICHPSYSNLAQQLLSFHCEVLCGFRSRLDYPHTHFCSEDEFIYDAILHQMSLTNDTALPKLPLQHLAVSTCVVPHIYTWLQQCQPLLSHNDSFALSLLVDNRLLHLDTSDHLAQMLQLFSKTQEDCSTQPPSLPLLQFTIDFDQILIPDFSLVHNALMLLQYEPQQCVYLNVLSTRLNMTCWNLYQYAQWPALKTRRHFEITDTRTDHCTVNLNHLIRTACHYFDPAVQQPLSICIKKDHNHPLYPEMTVDGEDTYLTQDWMDLQPFVGTFMYLQSLDLSHTVVTHVTQLKPLFEKYLYRLQHFTCRGLYFSTGDMHHIIDNLDPRVNIHLTKHGILDLYKLHLGGDDYFENPATPASMRLFWQAVTRPIAEIICLLVYPTHMHRIMAIDTRICPNIDTNSLHYVLQKAHTVWMHHDAPLFTSTAYTHSVVLPHDYLQRPIHHQTLLSTLLGSHLRALHLVHPNPPNTGVFYLHTLPKTLEVLVAPYAIWAFYYRQKQSSAATTNQRVFYYDDDYQPLVTVTPPPPQETVNLKILTNIHRFDEVRPVGELSTTCKTLAITRATRETRQLKTCVLASILPLEALSGFPLATMDKLAFSFGTVRKLMQHPKAYLKPGWSSCVTLQPGLTHMQFDNPQNWQDAHFVRYASCELHIDKPLIVTEPELPQNVISQSNRKKRKQSHPHPNALLAQLEYAETITQCKKPKV